MHIFWPICGVIWVSLSLLYAWFEGSKRRPGFIGCLIIMILFTPFFGYFIIESFSLKKAKVATGVVTNIMKLNTVVYAERMKPVKLEQDLKSNKLYCIF